MVRVFVGVSTALGVLLLVLGVSLSLFPGPGALVVSGILMLVAARVAIWVNPGLNDEASTSTHTP